jgi:hypothetical protein
MVAAISVVSVVGLGWPIATLLMEWQKDAPASSGLGNALSQEYHESIARTLAAQRKAAAFLRRTVWPVCLVCAAVLTLLIVIINVR